MYGMLCTRPDIAYLCSLSGISIQRLTDLYARYCRQKDSPIPQWINGSRNRVYVGNGEEGLVFRMYVDADWGASENRRSIGGFIIVSFEP